MAVFLGFLSLLTARPLLLGVMILANKERLSKTYRRSHQASSLAIAISGAGLIYYGFSTTNSLSTVMIIFGIIGTTTAIPEMLSLRKDNYNLRF